MTLDPDTIDTVRAYRAHVARVAPRVDWIDLLRLDWTAGGPRYSGFDVDRWHVLQRLRNVHAREFVKLTTLSAG